jgi:hypothetical protein
MAFIKGIGNYVLKLTHSKFTEALCVGAGSDLQSPEHPQSFNAYVCLALHSCLACRGMPPACSSVLSFDLACSTFFPFKFTHKCGQVIDIFEILLNG